MAFVRDLVRRRAAIVVDEGKEYLVESRLLPLARKQGLATVDDLVTKLKGSLEGPLHTEVVEAMTTNETSFYRDIHPFEALKSTFLPELVKARQATRQLRIWCAAASTGQEPYTIAMTIAEAFPELVRTWSTQIIATDINATVLARAKAGLYKQTEVNRGLPAPLLVKYFERAGIDWQIKPEIQKLVRFEQLNLLEKWPLVGTQDIVFMRNVLIYFDVPTKRTILGRVRQLLGPGGLLALGGAETTMNIDDEFEPVRASGTVFYRVKSKGG
jgi:chemotaxis protein methyltransferase CheR